MTSVYIYIYIYIYKQTQSSGQRHIVSYCKRWALRELKYCWRADTERKGHHGHCLRMMLKKIKTFLKFPCLVGHEPLQVIMLKRGGHLRFC